MSGIRDAKYKQTMRLKIKNGWLEYTTYFVAILLLHQYPFDLLIISEHIAQIATIYNSVQLVNLPVLDV